MASTTITSPSKVGKTKPAKEPEQQDPFGDGAQLNKKTVLVNFGLIGLIVAIVLGLFIWLWVGNLQESVPGIGQMVPEGHIRRVMAPFNGVVNDVKVKEDDVVRKGQVLIILDPEVAQIEQQSNMQQLVLLQDEAKALDAAYRGRSTSSASASSVSGAWLMAAQSSMDTKLSQAKLKIAEKQNDLNQVVARLAQTKEILASSEKLLTQYKALYEEGGVAQNEVITYEQKVLDQRGQVAQLEQEILARKNELEQAKRIPQELVTTFQEDVLTRLKGVQQQMAEYQGNFAKGSVALERQVIRAPIDGVVHQQTIRGTGDVVTQGQTLLTVVPGGSAMVAEVKVTNKDLAYIHLNQDASLMLDAFPYQRFGKLTGTVTAISPSTVEDEEGRPFYLVRITPEKSFMENQVGERFNIRSGMTVSADIITREKNILSIFTEPLQMKFENAFKAPSSRAN